MPIQPVNVGQAPDDGTGDPYRTAMQKLNTSIATLDGEKANTADVVVELEQKADKQETINALSQKVDKIAGKGLSDENYTIGEKQKLAGLESSRYRGLFVDLAALHTAIPNGRPGDYADVDSGAGAEVARYIWDNSDTTWVQQGAPATPLTAAQVKSLYESNPNTNAFTNDEKSKLGGVDAGAQKNMPTNLTIGNFTESSFDILSSTGTLATLTAATETQAGLMTVEDKLKLDAASWVVNTPSNRNVIINGAMQVAQRGAGPTASGSANVINADRFAASGTAVTFSSAVTGGAPQQHGFVNQLKITATGNVNTAANVFSATVYAVEGYDCARLYGRNITLSFMVMSNKVGEHAVAFRNSTGTRAFVASYTIKNANTWERVQVTVQGGIPLNELAANWNTTNGAGLVIMWGHNAGSDLKTANINTWADGNLLVSNSSANKLTTNGDYWAITGVQLEVGDEATAFEHMPIADTLSKCQRYFQHVVVGTVTWLTSTTSFGIVVTMPVEMRAAPTIGTPTEGTWAPIIINGPFSSADTKRFSIYCNGAANTKSQFSYVYPLSAEFF